MNAIQIQSTGGPEVLQLAELEIPVPGPGQVLIRVEAIGVNFIEIYFRKGTYKATLPLIPGSEAAGTVEDLGSGVTGFKPGDLVASVGVLGSYAEYALVPASQLVKVPDGLTPEQAAAAMLQGMTAHYLATSTYPLKAGDTALVHAGAGGVGLLLTQMASRIGARVITTVSTKEKAELSREAGAAEVILYTEQDFVAEVKKMTAGKGVDVVYDSVGKTTFEGSLNCLRPRGLLALFGGSSGPVPPSEWEGIVVYNEADAVALCGDAPGTRVALGRGAGRGGEGRSETAHGTYVSAGRGGTGAGGNGEPEDDGEDSAGTVSSLQLSAVSFRQMCAARH
jgi:NADPH:quinone reductase